MSISNFLNQSSGAAKVGAAKGPAAANGAGPSGSGAAGDVKGTKSKASAAMERAASKVNGGRYVCVCRAVHLRASLHVHVCTNHKLWR